MRELLTQALQENSSGRGSSKRIGLLMATTAMSVSIVLLSIAAMSGHEVSMALGAVAVPLAGLNGYSYVHKPENGNLTPDLRQDNKE